MVDVKIEPSWKELLKDEFEKPYFSELIQFVKSEYKVIRIDKEKILYIEGMSEYVCIYMEDRPKPVITLNSLQKLSAMLPSNFMRVHRSYIVQKSKIRLIDRGRIVFGKEYIPISDSYKQDLQTYLNNKTI